MSKNILTPAFLTKEIAKVSVRCVLDIIHDMKLSLPRMACHIVVLVPSMKDDRNEDFPDWPNYQIEPSVLYEFSLGYRVDWSPHKFDDIARCKALQLWHERNDDRTDCMPHLLFPGDTPYWGGVKRHGIVVTCSGFQPYFDKMFSGMIADMLIGLSYNLWAKTKDEEGFDRDFLP